jgi:hypothetical protein
VTGQELSEKYRELEASIAKEKGDFVLFALLMREDSPDRWDLVVSAPWLRDTGDAVEYLVDQIKSRIGEQNLTSLSRIIVVDPQAPDIQSFNRALEIEHGGVEVKDTNLFGLLVKQAFIITSKQPPAPAAA